MRLHKNGKRNRPEIIIDGPMQADTALVPEQQRLSMTFEGPANVLICPSLASANIAYKLLQRLAGAEMTGPILDGLARPAHVLQRGDSVRKWSTWLRYAQSMHREWPLRGSEFRESRCSCDYFVTAAFDETRVSLNIWTSRLATLSYRFTSDHVDRGWSISDGTPSQVTGILNPNLRLLRTRRHLRTLRGRRSPMHVSSYPIDCSSIASGDPSSVDQPA